MSAIKSLMMPLVWAMLCVSISGASAADLKDLVRKNPGHTPEWYADEAGVSEDEVVEYLLSIYRVPVDADRFDEVWEELATWENPLFITIVSGTVIEVHSKIPVGSYGQGFYNLGSTEGLSGHFQPKNIKAIYIIEEPSREGGVARQVAFYDETGHRVFGIFVNRLESGGEHHAGTLAQFKDMQARYRAELTG